MLVTVVLVFLACHSVKLVLSCYEVYVLVTAPGDDETASATATTTESAVVIPDYYSQADYEAIFGNATRFQYPQNFSGWNNYTEEEWHSAAAAAAAAANASSQDQEEEPPQDEAPPWLGHLTAISHWLLILNSSCNIAIYLHKDPRFKAVAKSMVLRALRMEGAIGGPGGKSPGSPNGGAGGDDLVSKNNNSRRGFLTLNFMIWWSLHNRLFWHLLGNFPPSQKGVSYQVNSSF